MYVNGDTILCFKTFLCTTIWEVIVGLHFVQDVMI